MHARAEMLLMHFLLPKKKAKTKMFSFRIRRFLKSEIGESCTCNSCIGNPLALLCSGTGWRATVVGGRSSTSAGANYDGVFGTKHRNDSGQSIREFAIRESSRREPPDRRYAEKVYRHVEQRESSGSRNHIRASGLHNFSRAKKVARNWRLGKGNHGVAQVDARS